MKKIIILIICLALVSCKKETSIESPNHQENQETLLEHIHITAQQAKTLRLETDTIRYRNMGASVEVTGHLEVPPQNEALITSVFGANIEGIKVQEGEEVRKGQILGYLAHPDLINLQSDYRKAFMELDFLKKEYERQQKLYDEGVAAGRIFQQAERSYEEGKDAAKALEAKLGLLHLNPIRIQKGHLYDKIPVISPIQGYVQEVFVRRGQFVEPQTTLFEVMNPEGIYVELKVYEQDAAQVKEGQEVQLQLLAAGNQEFMAKVYAVGKAFGSEPKALHVLAQLDDTEAKLLPGTYVKARIKSERNKQLALPEDAFVKVEDKYYVFVGEAEGEDWEFSAVEVRPGKTEDGWKTVEFLNLPQEESVFAHNNAYYILAEGQKGLGGHDH